MKQTVVFDFDGVIHSYVSGWKGSTVIPDPPVPGIGEAIQEIRKHYFVAVVSTRCSTPEGLEAITQWLGKYGIAVDAVLKDKPPAVAYIDDRAICFDGNPGTLLSKIQGFRTWMQADTSTDPAENKSSEELPAWHSMILDKFIHRR